MSRTKIKKRNVIIVVVIVICCIIGIPLLLILNEAFRATIYYNGIWRPEIPKYQGIDHYTNESYLEYDGCREASKYLPPLNEVNEATYANFYYVNLTPVETLFGNGAIAVCVGLQYDDSVYSMKKAEFLRKSQTEIYLDDYDYTESHFLTEEKLDNDEYLYFFAKCSDETKSIVYFVCIDDEQYSSSEMRRLCYAAGLETSDFWEYFFPPRKLEDDLFAQLDPSVVHPENFGGEFSSNN